MERIVNCPACTQSIELSLEVQTSLVGQASFACPTCGHAVPVPLDLRSRKKKGALLLVWSLVGAAVIAAMLVIFWPRGAADKARPEKEHQAVLWEFDFEDEEQGAAGWSELGFSAKNHPEGEPKLFGIN